MEFIAVAMATEPEDDDSWLYGEGKVNDHSCNVLCFVLKISLDIRVQIPLPMQRMKQQLSQLTAGEQQEYLHERIRSS